MTGTLSLKHQLRRSSASQFCVSLLLLSFASLRSSQYNTNFLNFSISTISSTTKAEPTALKMTGRELPSVPSRRSTRPSSTSKIVLTRWHIASLIERRSLAYTDATLQVERVAKASVSVISATVNIFATTSRVSPSLPSAVSLAVVASSAFQRVSWTILPYSDLRSTDYVLSHLRRGSHYCQEIARGNHSRYRAVHRPRKAQDCHRS